MPITRFHLTLALLPTAFLLASCGDVDTGPGSDPSSDPGLAGEQTLRSITWEDFPIVIDGVTVTDIAGSTTVDPYEFEIENNVFIHLEDFADVVTRWNSFRPCDYQPDAVPDVEDDLEDAKKSFHFDHPNAGAAYIDAAKDKGLHTIMPLPFIGDISQSTYYCNGVVDTIPEPDQLWNSAETVRIPLALPNYGAAKDIISPEFTSYWAAKAALYIQAIDAYDTTNVAWRWRVIEELRYWLPNEYAFAKAVRDTVNANDGTRPMVEYTPGHYLPEASTLYTLLERGLDNVSEATFTLDPADPVARKAIAGGVAPLYTQPLTVERNAANYLIELFDDVLTGAYTSFFLGEDGLENRIHPYHRIRLGREALDNLAYVYSTNSANESISQDPPDHILFHAPDLTAIGPYHTISGDYARHDFWAGIHEARGVWIYSMAYRGVSMTHAAAWEEYVRALYLIKSEMRPYLAGGAKTRPTLTNYGAQQLIDADDYISKPAFLNSHALALPESPDQYSTINHTLFRTGDIGYLIVTNSWDQEGDFDVEFPDCIDAATIVSGSSTDLSIDTQTLTDSFDGIDGRVYKIEFKAC